MSRLAVFTVFLAICGYTFARRQLVGGKEDVSTTDPNVIKVSKYAVEKQGDGWVLVKVISAKKQIVSGTKYYLKLSVKAPGNKKQTCTAEVTDIHHEKRIVIGKFDCKR